MATPPTFISSFQTVFNDSTTPKTASITGQTVGNICVSGGIAEDGSASTLTTPTGGPTWAAAGSVDVAAYTEVKAWSATAAATSWTHSQAFPANGGAWFGSALYAFSGSDGVGANNQTNVLSGAPSLALTTLGDNSAICVYVGDWTAQDGTVRTWLTVNSVTPTLGNGLEKVYFRDSAHYAAYSAYYTDAGAAGSKTVGLSAPGSQKYSITATEVKGAAGAGSTEVGFDQGRQRPPGRFSPAVLTPAGNYAEPGSTVQTASGQSVVSLAISVVAAGLKTAVGTGRSPLAADMRAAGSKDTTSTSGKVPLAVDVRAAGSKVGAGTSIAALAVALKTAGAKVGIGTTKAPIVAATPGAGSKTVGGTGKVPIVVAVKAAGSSVAIVGGAAVTALVVGVKAAGAKAASGAAKVGLAISLRAAGAKGGVGAATAPLTVDIKATGTKTGLGASKAVAVVSTRTAGSKSVSGTAKAPIVVTTRAIGSRLARGAAKIALAAWVRVVGTKHESGDAATPGNARLTETTAGARLTATTAGDRLDIGNAGSRLDISE